MQAPNQIPQGRRRVSQACDACRQRKVKCDGEELCFRCHDGGFKCTYYGVGGIQPRKKRACSRCRQRRMECDGDGERPCSKCTTASLECTYPTPKRKVLRKYKIEVLKIFYELKSVVEEELSQRQQTNMKIEESFCQLEHFLDLLPERSINVEESSWNDLVKISSCTEAEESSCDKAEESSCDEAEESSCDEAEESSCDEAEESSCDEAKESSCDEAEESSCNEAEESSCNEAEESSCEQSDGFTQWSNDFYQKNTDFDLILEEHISAILNSGNH